MKKILSIVMLTTCMFVQGQSTLSFPQGWSMFGYVSPEQINIMDAFTDISDNIDIVKDEMGLTYLPTWGFNALGDLEFAKGYQIKMIDPVDGFQFSTVITVNIDSILTALQTDINTNETTSNNAELALQEGLSSLQNNIVDINEATILNTSDLATLQTELSNALTVIQDLQSQISSISETPALQIGDFHAGGMVFYIDETGEHGLVAALADLGSMNWYEALISPEVPWYLPSVQELELMYNTIGSGGLVDDWYWSSSESSNNVAWVVNFNGAASYYSKATSLRVRAIRAF